MKQRILSILILLLGLFFITGSAQLSAQSPKIGIDSIFVKNQNDTHLKLGWNSVPGALKYHIALQGQGPRYTFTTTNTWWKINKDFLENNDGDVITFDVTVDYGGGTVSHPFGGPLVEVEIIYDKCDQASFDLNTQYLIYIGRNAMDDRMFGSCFKEYKGYVHDAYAEGEIMNDSYIPNCNASCINSYPGKRQHFMSIFHDFSDHSYIYEYSRYVCSEYQKTSDTPTELPQLYHLSPNPLSNSLWVSQSIFEDSDSHNILRIYNSQGRLMIEQQLDDAITTEVNTESLPAGIYITNIVRDGEIVQKAKLLKR